MKFTKIIPANLFKSKKSRSHSHTTSFSSDDGASSSSAAAAAGGATPTSVLPTEMEIYQAFEVMDRDGDGKIRKEELERLLHRLGAEPMSREEMNAMLSDVDRDGDGSISLDEFCATIGGGAAGGDEEELREAFDFFDSDGDGRITAEELLNVFRTIGEEECTLEECRRMIAEVDANGDGFVCFADFTRMMDPQQCLLPLQT